MKVTFVSQASLLIETSDCTILTDPWYMGTAFNDAWKLLPPPNWDNSMLDRIGYLWISHEHPDHFHIATLRSFPQSFKDRVVLLFQKNNSNKMPDAFAKFGFKNLRLMDNRKIYDVTDKTKVYVQQIGQMDSCLAVKNGGQTLLNLNDCEANTIDCKNLVADLGKIDVVFNQFSMAGYNGFYNYAEHLPKAAEQVLQNMLDNHRDLGVDITVPFASNIYFCMEDNKYMNSFGNTPRKAYDRFKTANLKLVPLYAGETLDMSAPGAHNDEASLKLYDELYANKAKFPIDTPPVVPVEKIREALKKRADQLRTKFPKMVLKKLKPMVVKIPDLNKVVRLSLFNGELTELNADHDFDVQIWSQPLFFGFDTPWGIQTMGVGARYLVKSNYEVWKWYRIITSLNNAEMYLKPKYLFTKTNVDFVRSRMKGGLNQLFYQLKRMSS